MFLRNAGIYLRVYTASQPRTTTLSELSCVQSESRSRGSSVSIVSDYGLDDRDSIPDSGRGFFF
jgi:hypothetical protein